MVWLGGQSPTPSLPQTTHVLVLEFWEDPQSQGTLEGANQPIEDRPLT